MTGYKVESVSVDGRTTALGTAGPFTLVVDRPVEAWGGGRGFNGGQLLNDAAEDVLHEPVRLVDGIAEIPNSIRRGTEVRLTSVRTASQATRL